MGARFTALASGSSGNSSLLQSDGYGLLIDFGLGARALGSRLAQRGQTWQHIDDVLLTHTHGDHWNETTLKRFVRLGSTLHCHESHVESLAKFSQAFKELRSLGHVRTYEPHRPIALSRAMTAVPFLVSHDANATFGFRIEGSAGLFGPAWAVGYAADLGCWGSDIATMLADVDLLALEFNHDEPLQRASGRPKILIRRVMGDRGHLSNAQAAKLVIESLRLSRQECLRHVVALHLSRDCNRPVLVQRAALDALDAANHAATVTVATPEFASPTLNLGDGIRWRRSRMTRAEPIMRPNLFSEPAAPVFSEPEALARESSDLAFASGSENTFS